MDGQTVWEAARRAVSLGISVVPPREDGSKAPEGYWTEFQSRTATPEEINAWYAPGRNGVGVVTGAVSGGLELFEFEGRAVDAGIWTEYCEAVTAAGLDDVFDRVLDGYCEDTPSGGVHLLWRCPEIEGSTTLARCVEADKPRVLIETRGERGYTIIAPSGGRVHPSGGEYWVRTGGLETIATVTPEERSGLLDLARSFDQIGPSKAAMTAVRSQESGAVRPGDGYNTAASWPEILEPHGWTHVYSASDGNEHWRRPDKHLGTSATVSPDGQYLYVFSTSTPFDAERAYNKFGAYAVLNHGGDFQAAARSLRGDGYGDDRELSGPAKGKPSQSKLLVELAVERYRFATTQDGRPFAICNDGPKIARMLRGGKDSLRADLAKEFFERYAKAASTSAMAEALLVMEGLAGGTSETVHLRIGAAQDSMVLDLGDHTGRVVVITADGWEVVDESPIIFERSALTAPLPVPVTGGSLEEFHSLLNVNEKSWSLIVGTLVGALFPDIPHPIPAFFGEQGTAKTTTAGLCASVIDPSPAQVRTAPRDVEGWAVTANGSWVVALDNISRIPEWLSDALCRAVTGDALVRRQLYTDAGVSVLAFRRLVMITSIDISSLRGDLADRLVPIDLQRIPPEARRTDQEITDAWQQAHPRVLGALLTLVSEVLRALPDVRLAEHPRMADFARILAAIDQVRDLGALDAYLGLADRIAEDVIESDPVAQAVAQYMRDKQTWAGTASELLANVTTQDRPPRDWPTSAHIFSGTLKRSAPALRQAGIEIDFGGRTSKKRLIILTNTAVENPSRRPLQWVPIPKSAPPNRDAMTLVTLDDTCPSGSVIAPQGSDQGEHVDRDADDACDGPQPLSSDEEKEEERDELAELIATFEREFDAIVIAEYPTVRLAA